MAGTASFDDILGSLVTDESDRAVLSELAVKYPEVKNGWLRQSDYSRKLDSFRDIEREAQTYKGKVGEWEGWAKENWDFEANRPKMEVFWERKAQELESKVGTEMTFDDITKAIKEQGLVSKPDLEAMINSKAVEVDKGFSGAAYFSAKIAEKVGEHYSEFKKPLKVTELVSKMQEYGTNDLDAAYDKYVADARKERNDKDLEAKIAEIRKEEREKAVQETLAKLPSGGLPVDQGESGLSHFEAKLKQIHEPNAMENAELGKGTIAAIAAQEYAKKQLGTA